MLQGQDEPNWIGDHLRELGYYLSHKSQAGKEVDFTGFTIDTIRKTIKVRAKTLEKLKNLVQKNVLTSGQGEKVIHFKALEELIGVINFAAKTSTLGRTKLFHLITALNGARDELECMVRLPEAALSELRWWQEKEHVLPMKAFKVTGAYSESYSDASGSYSIVTKRLLFAT